MFNGDTIFGDGHVVDLHRLQATDPGRFPFLLQSLAGGGGLSRYDILFAFPQQSLVLHSLSALRGPFAAGQADFLAALERWYLSQRCDTDGSTGPLFSGGWFVYLGYEVGLELGMFLPEVLLVNYHIFDDTFFALRLQQESVRFENIH